MKNGAPVAKATFNSHDTIRKQALGPPQKYRYGDEPVPMLGTGSSPYRYFWGGPKACFLVVEKVLLKS